MTKSIATTSGKARRAAATTAADVALVAQPADSSMPVSPVVPEAVVLGQQAPANATMQPAAGGLSVHGETTAMPARCAAPSQPAYIYPKEALGLLRTKCPAVRAYCAGQEPVAHRIEFHLGVARTLSVFDGGSQVAEQASRQALNFDQVAFDAALARGRLPGVQPYTCQQARVDGVGNCPAGGCPLPDDTVAKAPLDVLMWGCDVRQLPPRLIAKSVVASEFGQGLIGDGEHLYAYDNGIYREVDTRKMERRIYSHVAYANGNRRLVKEIDGILCLGHVRDVDTITPDSNFICFRNGTLNVEARRLERHDPQHLLLNQIPHDYDAQATCPGFLAFLDSIWQPDQDRAEKIQFLRQWLGYLLCADTRQQKMLILLGQGANGKSVLLEVCRHLLGEQNTASAMLDRLKNPDVRATLRGKLLNQSADLPKRTITADGDLKAIISGDAIEVSPKFQRSHSIRPYARLMVATNNMPNCGDTTDGYFRRLVILEFHRRFAEGERNTRLTDQLILEMPGIVAWAVEGLYEMRARGGLTIPSSSAHAVQSYRNDLSPVRQFAAECLDHSDDRSGFKPTDLFAAYQKWCQAHGFPAENMISLGRSLASLGFDQRRSTTTIWLVKVKSAGEPYFARARTVGQLHQYVPIELLPSSQQDAATSGFRYPTGH